MAKNYYAILGVDRNATTEEIKKAFRKVARETHPDANPDDPEAEARFKLAAEAYEVLSDPDRRRSYDRGDTIEFEVSAVDAEDESEPWRSPPIRVINSPPVIASSPAGLREDGTFRYRIEPKDPDGDRVFRYRLVEGPKGMQLDWLSGVVTWRPGDDQAGSHAVKLEADDQRGGVAVQSFQITVEIAPKAAAPPAKADR